RRRRRLGFGAGGGDRGVVGQGAPSSRRARRAAPRARAAMTLLALAVSGRGVVDPDEPWVHADDEAFLRGRAAFETARVYGGRPFRLAAHVARLTESARRLGLPPVDAVELRRLIDDALAAAGAREAVLRFYW